MLLSSHEIAFCARKAGFTEEDAIIMVAIVLAETNGDTDYLLREERTYPDGDFLDELHGLARISSVLHSDKLKDWRNPFVNMQMAFQIFKSGRFTNWDSWNTNSYKKWLSIAHNGVEQPVKPRLPELLLDHSLDLLENVEHELLEAAVTSARIEEKHLALIEQQMSTVANTLIQVRNHFR